MQILFINILKHVCQGTRSKETTDGLLKKMGGRKPTKPGYEYMTSDTWGRAARLVNERNLRREHRLFQIHRLRNEGLQNKPDLDYWYYSLVSMVPF